jgi:hypothetical protein
MKRLGSALVVFFGWELGELDLTLRWWEINSIQIYLGIVTGSL